MLVRKVRMEGVCGLRMDTDASAHRFMRRLEKVNVFARGIRTGRWRALVLIVLFLCAAPFMGKAEIYGASYVKDLGIPGKYLMHLEGTPYEIGYAMGYLKPNEVVKLVHGEYAARMVGLMLHVSYLPYGGTYVDYWLKTTRARALLDKYSVDVPAEYKEEMRGIADGVNAALGKNAVTYYHVLLVNLFPALQTLNLTGPLLGTTASACHGFVAFGDATVDGRTLMGRHFMWLSNPLHDITCFAEYVPSHGNRFLVVTFPGMVGVITGLNSAGVGVGTDFFNAKGQNASSRGLGMWLLGRKVLQYASSISGARGLIPATEISPCFLLVGSAAGAGAVFEIFNGVVSPRPAGWATTNAAAPRQLENFKDLVVVSNHAFTSGMYGLDRVSRSSLIRYEVLTTLLAGSYGSLDQRSALSIIDFMHPPSTYMTGGYEDYGYGGDAAQTVKQHVALMDLQTRTIWTLWGHYNGPWVKCTLR